MSKNRYWLVARDKPALLVALLRALAGDAHLSLEGDLSRCRLGDIPGASVHETDVLKRMTTNPRQDFVVVPVEAETIYPILAEVLPEGRIVREIIHVQIEKSGRLVFGAYDNFQPDCIVAWPVIPEAFLQDLQSRGILRSFELVTELEH